MSKGEDYFNPNAIVDFDLKILETNSFFYDFFNHQKDWKKLPAKITDLIEFDNLNEFKKAVHSIHSFKNSHSSFNGKIKISEEPEPIKITINKIGDEQNSWSNQAVELTCQKIKTQTIQSKAPTQIVQASPLKIFTVDREYRLTFFSDSATTLLEFLFVKKPIVGELIYTDGIKEEEWKNYFDIIFSSGSLFLEKNYQKEGKEFYDLLSFSGIKNERGEIEGCIIYANDILQLKKVEIQHYQNHKKYQHLFENNFLGIGVLDKHSILINANDSFCKLVGIKNSSLEKIRVHDFIFGDSFELIHSKMKEIYKGEISDYTSVIRFENVKHEIRYAQVGLNGLYEYNKFSGCLLSILDISDQKEIQFKEQELKNLKTKEQINLNHQILLQKELDTRLRELASNQMLIAQKNNLINEIKNKLEQILRKSDKEIRFEIRKMISSINHKNVFDDDWENLKLHFIKMHPSFFKTLTSLFSKITEKDLRHCAYIKLGFSAKETSDLLGTLPRSIEQARFRIKKKMNLPADQRLSEFLRNI